MTDDDPHAHLPLMQRPDFIYRPHHRIVARNIKVGDIVLESENGKSENRWTVTGVRLDDRMQLVYVTYQGWKREVALAQHTERVWIARVEDYPPKKETP